MPLFAVHISDGILAAPWWVGGMLIAAVLIFAAAYRIPHDVIPRLGLLTAAFFIASLIHVRFGPTSVHLLLNGLVGVTLGRFAALAIFQGLVLQFLMIAHGGMYTIGINTCILTIPALLGGYLFSMLAHWRMLETRAGRWALTALASFLFLTLSAASVEMLLAQWSGRLDLFAMDWQQMRTLQPDALLLIAVASSALGSIERWLEPSPGFPLGLLIGLGIATLTVLFNFVVLLFGTEDDWRTLATLVLLAHLPIVVIEGLIVGFTVSFLMRAKPELLRLDDRGTAHA